MISMMRRSVTDLPGRFWFQQSPFDETWGDSERILGLGRTHATETEVGGEHAGADPSRETLGGHFRLQGAITLILWRKKGWHLKEPGKQINREEPRRFELMVSQSFAEGIIGKHRAKELLGRPIEDLSTAAA